MQFEFLQAYNFTIKYKTGVQNVITDAFSRKHALLTFLHVKIIRFDIMKELYYDDDFEDI